jgi:hypothetical protein
MKGCTIKDFVNKNYSMTFRRRLHGNMANQWERILGIFNGLNLTYENDSIFWDLTSNKVFSTKSMYEHLEKELNDPNNKMIWKAKIPLKIQIFTWQVFRTRFLLEIICAKESGRVLLFVRFANKLKVLSIYSFPVL